MNKLQLALHRLYGQPADAGHDIAAEASGLIDACGQVRAMVLEIARPADWELLAKVWRGVQVDLELPAPAIAVSGEHGYQLWFSLAQPEPVAQATVFLESLRLRYLGDIKPQRVGLMPMFDASSPRQALHARMVPALQTHSGHWSAFVAPELAPVFADEPWLDTPPNPDGQCSLLSRLDSIQHADFLLAIERLEPATMSAIAAEPASDLGAGAVAGVGPMNARLSQTGPWQDPTSFLLDVMNNDAVDLRLRIEAAKSLLPHFDPLARC